MYEVNGRSWPVADGCYRPSAAPEKPKKRSLQIAEADRAHLQA